MERTRLAELEQDYRRGLLEDTLPFWIPAAVDREYGGFHFCLDRQGKLYETDKGVWQQGRFSWLLGTLHVEVEPRPEWLELCRHGVEFLRARADGPQGRLWFHLDREGRGVRQRRYVFGEAFAAQGCAALARAAGDEQARDWALAYWETLRRHMTQPGLTQPKFEPGRQLASIGGPMIRMGVAQVLRWMEPDERFAAEIDECLDVIQHTFVRDDLRAVLECVGPDGLVSDHLEGRTLNPGHALEAAWFVLEEALYRDRDAQLVDLGCRMVDYAWERGWDERFGGLLYFTDLFDKPVQEYWHDMKFWWPHCEAILATLLAHQLTGEERFARRHQQVHDWSRQHLADERHGEWFGYLARDGRRTSEVKGNLWKGPFHLPRMQLRAWRACSELLDQDGGGE